MKIKLCKATPLIGLNSVLKHNKCLIVKKDFLKLISLVCEDSGISHIEMQSERKTKHINEARQIAIYILRRHTEISLKSIGSFFGNRHHSTVIHSIQTIDDLLTVDKKLASKIRRISNKINQYIYDNQPI